jgi:hypothetical protein
VIPTVRKLEGIQSLLHCEKRFFWEIEKDLGIVSIKNILKGKILVLGKWLKWKDLF